MVGKVVNMHALYFALSRGAAPLAVATLVIAPAWADSAGIDLPDTGATRPCVDVDIAGERTPDYGCLTVTLRRTVEATKPIANVPPGGLQPPPNQVGLITPTEVRQQYGPNFGKSVVPYRPQRNYPIPLVNGQR